MEVRAKYEMIENDDEGTACHEFEEGEDDEFQCHSRCRLELIRVLHTKYICLFLNAFQFLAICQIIFCIASFSQRVLSHLRYCKPHK